MSSMPERANAKVGNIVLRKVPEGKGPGYFAWKKLLEKEWAGDWTIAKLTGYRYKVGLDPAFVEERTEFRRGILRWFEWLLMQNGGIVYLFSYDVKEMIFCLLTTKQTAEKVLGQIKEAHIASTLDERLSHEIHFPGTVLMEVCELAGVRRARRVSEEQKVKLRERGLRMGFGSVKRMPPTECQRQVEAAHPSVRVYPRVG